MTKSSSVEEVLTQLLRKGRLQPRLAVERIRRAGRGLTLLAIREGLAALARSNRITGVTIDGQVVGMLGWQQIPVETADPRLVQWQAEVAAIDQLEAARRAALMSPPNEALELDKEDQRALIKCLAALRPDLSPGEDPYVYSAAGILGSSKVLDQFTLVSDLVLDNSVAARARRPMFVITAGPAVPSSVLFIENQSAFASQLRAGFPSGNLAVCAFGYGLTLENLAPKLDDGSVIACPAGGERPDLVKVLHSVPCFFWGDLDLEGLRIYEALRRAIPHLQLSAVYARMAEMLTERRRSHPYSGLFGSGKAGQRVPLGETAEVRLLANLCAQRAVDQEAVCPVRDTDILVSAYAV